MGKVERKVYNYNYQSMLFTKATECGVKLENATILSPELWAKAQIPANNARISEWAKDNHVNIMFEPNNTSDFNCKLGIMMESEVAEGLYNTNKKMLKNLGNELIRFISDLPSNVDEAADEAIIANELKKLAKEFYEKVYSIAGHDVFICLDIFKLSEDEG